MMHLNSLSYDKEQGRLSQERPTTATLAIKASALGCVCLGVSPEHRQQEARSIRANRWRLAGVSSG
jgi:hypothetical protein